MNRAPVSAVVSIVFLAGLLAVIAGSVSLQARHDKLIVSALVGSASPADDGGRIG